MLEPFIWFRGAVNPGIMYCLKKLVILKIFVHSSNVSFYEILQNRPPQHNINVFAGTSKNIFCRASIHLSFERISLGYGYFVWRWNKKIKTTKKGGGIFLENSGNFRKNRQKKGGKCLRVKNNDKNMTIGCCEVY